MKTCVEGFATAERVVGVGEEVEDDDPIVKRFPRFFGEGTIIEQATAAPGEFRTVKPARKRTAKKTTASKKK
jgi:hypothetical protein